jgi:L-rhamnose mutarotase
LISVVSGDASVVKKVSELWGFQIKRLYEIYIEEQMSLQILMAEEESEKEIIESQRVSRLERWQRIMDKIKSEREKIEEEKERQRKLDELKKLL